MPRDPFDNDRVDSQSKIPGRLYLFVVALLATFVVGLTVVALWDRAERGAPTVDKNHFTASNVTAGVSQYTASDRSGTAVLDRDQLQRLASIALGVAILSLIPSRKTASAENDVTARTVAHSSGLPVLGNVLTSPSAKRASTSKGQGARIRGFATISELVLCIAFMLALTACFLKPELLSTFRSNPLVGYVEAARHLATTVLGWFNHGQVVA